MPQPLVLFDFDGTVVRGDTLRAFVTYGLRREPWRMPPTLVALGLTFPLLGSPRTTTRAVSALFRGAQLGVGTAALRAAMAAFVTERSARPWLYAGAARALTSHVGRGDRVVIVTGCEEELARAVCDALGIPNVEIVGSRIASRPSGHVLLDHCYHERKLPALAGRGLLPPFDHVYTDSAVDLPLLRCARRGTLVNPSARTERAVRARVATPIDVVHWA
jgi:phosphatidylglycerophosphatase C